MCGDCLIINNQNVYCCTLPEYPEGNKIFVIAQLEEESLEEVRWKITDKFFHSYSGVSELDNYGNFIINLDDLQDELLTRHSGEFYLSIFKNVDAPCEKLNFKFCNLEPDQTVNLVKFSMYKHDSQIKAFIGCVCDDPEVVPAEEVDPV